MKRHICAGAGALVLALAGAGTATAGGLPVLGGEQLGLQSVSLGDQSVGEQSNDASVTQSQGNGNVNISPALAVGGDASTSNAQGNGNTAVAGVDQSNEASQSQTVDQAQRLTGGSEGCCGSGTQDASQAAEGGDQSVGEQSNDASVTQSQGNGNVNVSPAIAIGGDASTRNEQGNGNTAVAFVDQANAVDQSQGVSQEQSLKSGGGSCCGAPSQSAAQRVENGPQTVDKQVNRAAVTQEQGNGNVNVSPAIAFGGDKHESCGPCSKGKGGDGGSASASTWNAQGNGNKAVALVGQDNTATQSQDVSQTQALRSEGCCAKPTSYESPCKKPTPPKDRCGDESGQTGEQSVRGGDQSVGKQKNEGDVTQEQGNGNVNVSPAIAFGGDKHESCGRCSKGKGGDGGSASASTWNAQGNGNKAVAGVSQGNTATQSQSTWQGQRLVDACKEVVRW